MRALLFRADGNDTIGWGHISRCLAIAEHLQKEVLTTNLFTTEKLPKHLQMQAKAIGVLVLLLDKKDPWHIPEHIDDDWTVVMDGYHFPASYYSRMKETGCRLIVIDDECRVEIHPADFIINHAPGVKATDYLPELKDKLRLGAGYAMLRKPFYSLVSLPVTNPPSAELLICFGGSTLYTSVALKVIEAALAGNQFEHINWITTDPRAKRMDKKVTIKKNLDANEMATQMRNSLVTVVPASTVAMEAWFARTTIITGLTADNQWLIYAGLIKQVGVFGTDNWLSATVPEIATLLGEAHSFATECRLEPLNYNTNELKSLFQ